MEKGLLKALVLILILSAFSSCSRAGTYVSVVKGNYLFHQGKYPESTLHYLSSLEKGEYPEWISYDLGNVYHALGELEAAFEVWDSVKETESADLLFRTRFNKGVLLYELGRYREAYDEFRQALEIDSNDIDAKVNLELSLQKIQALNRAAGAGQSEVESGQQGEKDETGRILEYVRRKEGLRWNTAQAEDESSDRQDW